VSAVTGAGLEELLRALRNVADRVQRERASRDGRHGPAVLHVDRAFTLHGIGTVVTGTLWSGAIEPGERVEVLPSGAKARVRSVQVHNRDVGRALAGQRVALNLGGVSPEEVPRGHVVASAGSGLIPSYRLDVELSVAQREDFDGRRVQIHHGTRAVPGRVTGLGKGLAQLRLESQLVARPGDRFVVRAIGPARTLGGGLVLDPAPARHGPRSEAPDRLLAIKRDGLDAVRAGDERSRDEARAAAHARRVRSAEAERRRPLDARERLLLALLRAGADQPDAPGALARRLGMETRDAVAGLDRLVARGDAVRVAPDLYYASDVLERLRSRALQLAQPRGEITLAQLRDGLGTSRRYAQALLAHLDATKRTVRHGDRHVLRRAEWP
jgi:selenocysteine-specific elongation factor